MLVAQLNNGKLFSLADEQDYTKLIQLREDTLFYCPGCKAQVTLKLGHKRRWHFSHFPGQLCSYQNEPETDFHLKGKQDLYQWLKAKYETVSLEHYLPTLHQRPDIFLHSPVPQAIEFQCSTISRQLMFKRNQGYKQMGYPVLWILGENRLHPVTSNIFQIHEMDWHALTRFSSKQYGLVYYSPDTEILTLLTHLIPISRTKLLAIKESRPLTDWQFPWTFYSKYSYHDYLQAWIAQKKHWRLTAFLEKSSAHAYVKAMYLRKSFSLSQFSPYVGLPLSSNLFIRTAAFLWQGWIDCQYILDANSLRLISIKQVYKGFMTMFQKGIFEATPVADGAQLYKSLIDYFNALVKLNIIKPCGKEQYKRENSSKSTKQLEELLKKDEEVLKIIL